MTRYERSRSSRSARRKPLRFAMAAAAAALLAATASGCGSSETGDTADGPVELRFSWWGNSDRAEITQQAIDKFEEANPNITVKPEFADFNGYFDRLATTVAGGDAPDVITLGGAYPREYGDRGALLATITGANLFTEPYLLTGGGGPNGASTSPVLLMYQKGIEQGNPDVAAAIGVILIILVLVIALIQRRLVGG